MKHIFIVNPVAGPTNCTAYIRQLLEDSASGYNWELYETKCQGDAARYCAKRVTETEEKIRFYACGGDGTINGVVSGIVGHPNASFGVFPCGSGNDYVKHFGGAKYFLDIPALLKAPEIPVDVMKVGDRYGVNICNFGFDAAAADTMNHIKRKKIIGGSNAYVSGVVKALATDMRTSCKVTADGEEICSRSLLLCSLANGSYYGGAFRCAPRSKCSDGKIDICLVLPISRISFVKLVGKFKDGKHFEIEELKDKILYRRVSHVTVSSEKEICFCMDGEITHGKNFTIDILPGCVSLALPEGAREQTPQDPTIS